MILQCNLAIKGRESMYNYLKNQQGSVTAIGLIAVTFFIIVLAGSMIYS